MEAPVAAPGIDNWTEVLPHRDDVKLDGIDVFADYLVLFERAEALRRIRVMRLADGDIHTIDQPEPVYTAGGGSNPSSTRRSLRFGYTSMVTPQSVYDYDIEARHTRADQAAAGPRRLRRRRSTSPSGCGPRRPTANGCRCRSSTGGDTPIDGSGAVPAVRLRLVRAQHRPGLLVAAAQPARPRLRLRHRPHPRRRRDGPALVRRRQDAAQAQHVHRLHRLSPSTWSPRATRRPSGS